MVLVSSNPATFWLFLIWMAGAGILYIGGAIWMYVRRDVQPIKARDNGLSLLTNIAYVRMRKDVVPGTLIAYLS